MTDHKSASSPAQGSRKAIHTRSITFVSYERDDGFWDVEGTISDSKHYPLTQLERQELPAGAPYHSMRVTFTVDDQLRIVNAVGDMLATPFDECAAAPLPLQKLIGATLGKGWRKVLDEALDRSSACTHMREMLNALPTAAIQSIPGYIAKRRGLRWPPEIPVGAPAPHFMDGCVSWRRDGAVVLRQYPQFYRPKADEEERVGESQEPKRALGNTGKG